MKITFHVAPSAVEKIPLPPQNQETVRLRGKRLQQLVHGTSCIVLFDDNACAGASAASVGIRKELFNIFICILSHRLCAEWMIYLSGLNL